MVRTLKIIFEKRKSGKTKDQKIIRLLTDYIHLYLYLLYYFFMKYILKTLFFDDFSLVQDYQTCFLLPNIEIYYIPRLSMLIRFTNFF